MTKKLRRSIQHIHVRFICRAFLITILWQSTTIRARFGGLGTGAERVVTVNAIDADGLGEVKGRDLSE